MFVLRRLTSVVEGLGGGGQGAQRDTKHTEHGGQHFVNKQFSRSRMILGNYIEFFHSDRRNDVVYHGRQRWVLPAAKAERRRECSRGGRELSVAFRKLPAGGSGLAKVNNTLHRCLAHELIRFCKMFLLSQFAFEAPKR